jgi:hypothetical protein
MCGTAQVIPRYDSQVREEVAQPAKVAETAKPFQTGPDVPAAKEKKLTAPRMLAGAAAATTDEEGRVAWKAAYLALLADTRARHHARLAAMKQLLPSLAAWVRKLWQDVGGARRPVPTEVHLRPTATVGKQLEKAEVLLGLMEGCLVPTEKHLMEAEVHLRSAKEPLKAAEAQVVPEEAPQMSTVKAVVGAPQAGESAEGHWRQSGRRGVQTGSAVDGKNGPQEVVQTACHNRVSPQGQCLEPLEVSMVPARGTRRPAKTPPASAGARCKQCNGAGCQNDGSAGRTCEKRVVREKQMAAERHELRPPVKAPGRQSGGEVARTGFIRQPERIEVRLSSDGCRVAARVC